MRLRLLLAATVGLASLIGEAPRALATSPGGSDLSVLRQASARLGHERRGAVIRWLRGQSTVASARVGRDGRTLDVRYRDGREMFVLPARLSRVRVPSGLQVSRPLAPHISPRQSAGARAAVLEPFAWELFVGDGSNAGAPEVSALQHAGFSVDSLNNSAVTVQFMASLPSYRVVYMHTHSGTSSGGEGVLATGEPDDNNPAVAQYLADGSVVPIEVAGTTNVYYGLTSRFFASHVPPFSRDSVLFLNGCKLLPATLFWNALASRGVGAMVSWSEDALPADEYLAAASFFNSMSGGQTVDSALQATIAAGYGKSTYNNVTATLGYRGDGSITLARAAGGQVTPPTATPRPTATGVPTSAPTAIPTATRTRTPVPTSTPRPTETSIPFLLRIARLASPTVAPGQIQTVDVQSTANTALVAFRIMPNGTQSLLRATTNASGAATISFKQPGSAITRHSRIARVAVRVGSDPQDREVSASYTIAFGKIDLAVDRHTPVRPGSEASIWVHTAARIRVDLSAHAAGHRATGMHASTGANGWVKFVFTVPRGTGANQRVSLTATARRSGKLYAAKTKLTVA